MFFKGAVSADSHVVEPEACFQEFIDPAYRDRAPHLEVIDGQEFYVIPGIKKPVASTFAQGAGLSAAERAAYGPTSKLLDRLPSAGNPSLRLADQDHDGVCAEVLYASVGMVICGHPDVSYKQACMDSYNRWLETYCAFAPKRLFGLGMTPVKSIDQAIKDFEDCKKKGLVGMMLPGEPGTEVDYDHPDFDALWQCAVALGMPVSFHILTSRNAGVNDVLNAKTRGHKMMGGLNIMRAVQDIVALFVLGGVFERVPDLKFVTGEADAGWMVHYMARIDRLAMLFEDGKVKGLSKPPSAYLKEHISLSFQDDSSAFLVKDHLKLENLLWGNDFPHSDSTWPHSQAILSNQASGLTQMERQKILRDNTVNLYGLQLV